MLPVLFSTAVACAQHSLQQVYEKRFKIGAAVNEAQIAGRPAADSALLLQHFNAVTPENIMKAENIHPKWLQYHFAPTDALVAFARRHGLQLNAHTLIWHSQLPPFVRQMKSADSVRLFFEEHIRTVAGRYKNDVFSWDVVNEALNEDGTMRRSIFLDKLGDNYVTEAFRLAQQAAPNVELYYNDYNNEQPAKRAGCIALMKKVQQAGVRIDGVGIQGHWQVGKVPLKDIEESIEAYAAMGLKVMITELDIEVLPRNFSGADVGQRTAANPALNPYAAGMPDSVLQQQAADYEALFRLFTKHRDKISRVTFWGLHDGQTWLNDWPVRGRTNYPLLFDRQRQPKPAFQRVISVR